MPYYPGIDVDQLLQQGLWGIMTIVGGALLFAFIWAIKEGRIKPVVFKYGDRGFLEIFGFRTPILIKGGTWIYIEGIITESKTSVRKQPGKIVRRDKVGNQIVITAIDYYYHVIDTPDKIRAAIYEFVDPEVSGGLSDGVNVAFQRYIETQICWAAMQLVEMKSLNGQTSLLEQFEALCSSELSNVGVALDQTRLVENAPPDVYATAGVLGQFMPVPVAA